MNCIAIDDEPMALEVIKAYCKNIEALSLSHTFTQVSLAQKHLRKFPVDLIFLDINMPDTNGIDFSKSLPQNAMVIFTTAYSEYAIDGFDVQAIDYLLKPIEFSRFETACKKALEHYDFHKSKKQENEEACLHVRSEYALIKVPFSEITYLETVGDYIRIHQEDKKAIMTLMSMKTMLQKLPVDQFKRVHRSYTVRWDKIDFIRGNQIAIMGQEIPIGTSYRKAIRTKYQQ